MVTPEAQTPVDARQGAAQAGAESPPSEPTLDATQSGAGAQEGGDAEAKPVQQGRVYSQDVWS